MAKDNDRNEKDSVEARIARALADAQTAKRRATMALGYAKVALNYSISTPKVGAMIREIDKELQSG